VNITSSTLTPDAIQAFRGLNLPGGPDYSTVTAQAVIEPASLVLLGTGLAAVTGSRLRRKKPAS
jgi:hypothetical protein